MSRAFQEKRSFAAAGAFGGLICVGGMGVAVFAQSGSEKSKVSREAVRTPQGGVAAESLGEGRNKNAGLSAGQIRDALIQPETAQEISYFAWMLRATARNLTEEDVQTLIQSLTPDNSKRNRR
jgi:hypothetical protein